MNTASVAQFILSASSMYRSAVENDLWRIFSWGEKGDAIRFLNEPRPEWHLNFPNYFRCNE
jgi:hypothetical protein